MPRDDDLSTILTRVMLEIALRQPDPADRAAMIDIMRHDGWLPDDTKEAA